MTAGKLVVCNKREGFTYGNYRNGKPVKLSFGDVVRLQGFANDDKLLKRGYFIAHDPALHGEVEE